MKYRSLALTLALVLAACAVTGCGHGAGSENKHNAEGSSSSGINLKPEINRETGEIVLPSHRFFINPEESNLLTDVSVLARQPCEKKEGVDFAFTLNTSEYPAEYLQSQEYGVWLKESAERFAFVMPMTRADMAANGVTINGKDVSFQRTEEGELMESDAEKNANLTDEQWEVIMECGKEPEVVQFSESDLTPRGPWDEKLEAAHEEALNSSAAEELNDKLHACYSKKGLQPDDDADASPYSVKGARYMEIDEEQVAMALSVVECKDEVDYVRTMANVVAEFEAPILEEYAQDLKAQRTRVDEALEKANEYKAEYLRTHKS